MDKYTDISVVDKKLFEGRVLSGAAKLTDLKKSIRTPSITNNFFKYRIQLIGKNFLIIKLFFIGLLL